MSTFSIPLIASPQLFNITLAGTLYTMTCRWNGEMPAWTLDVANGTTNEVLFLGLPLVTGVDLLAQFRCFVFGGALVAETPGGEANVPATEFNLGTESFVFFITPDA